MIHLGKGGYGEVYQCGEKAIKVIKCPKNGIWCYNEICLIQNLSHPYILSPDYAYLKYNQVHIVMAKADIDLSKWRKCNIPTETQILEWITQILSALAFMHNRDILHCDIKASNLLLFTNPKSPKLTIKLADFSLCRRIGHRNRVHVCTHSYRPPEYWTGTAPNPGYWVDIWSLGCVLYHLIRGTLLFPPHQPKKNNRGIVNKLDRAIYYGRIYTRWREDYKSLKLPIKLIHRLVTLMLNPNYQERPTAESLLTMIAIRTGNKLAPTMGPSLSIITSISDLGDLNIQLMTLSNRLGLTLDFEIKRLTGQIIRVIPNLVNLNPELYLLTAVWMSSKIILDQPYDLTVLGQPSHLILAAEQTICTVSRFKFSII